MEFKDILEFCKAQAICNTIEPTELSVWRSICRSYSKKFHTPLHVVLAMDPEAVMIAEFEDQLEDFDKDKDLEAILDQIYTLEDPEYEGQKRQDLDDFIDHAEHEEQERIKAGKPIHKSMKNETSLKTLPEKSVDKPKKLPASGGINLSYLEKEESGMGNGFNED